MATGTHISHDVADALASETSPYHRHAVVWFVVMLVVGLLVTYSLAQFDRIYYNRQLDVFDYTAYKENRWAQGAIGQDRIDERGEGDLMFAVDKLSHADKLSGTGRGAPTTDR